jgi:hypothetical protein
MAMEEVAEEIGRKPKRSFFLIISGSCRTPVDHHADCGTKDTPGTRQRGKVLYPMDEILLLCLQVHFTAIAYNTRRARRILCSTISVMINSRTLSMRLTLDPIAKATKPPKVILEREIYGDTQQAPWINWRQLNAIDRVLFESAAEASLLRDRSYLSLRALNAAGAWRDAARVVHAIADDFPLWRAITFLLLLICS